MDALHLRTLGLGGVLASSGEEPTEVQLVDLLYKTVYFRFSMYPCGLRNTKKPMRSINHPATYYLRWEEAGVKCAKEVGDKAQFRSVFEHRIKIVFPEWGGSGLNGRPFHSEYWVDQRAYWPVAFYSLQIAKGNVMPGVPASRLSSWCVPR